MRFTIQLTKNHIRNVMRQCGYIPAGYDEETGELRFYRPLSRGPYPRFHIYCISPEQFGTAKLNLHIDQKAPSYGGSRAHSGEYEGDVVENEATRIMKLAAQNA